MINYLCPNNHNFTRGVDFTRGVIIKKMRFKTETYKKNDRACEGGASTIRRLAVRIQRPYPAEEYMEKKIATEMSFKNVTCKYMYAF